jgi:hypothetical protein
MRKETRLVGLTAVLVLLLATGLGACGETPTPEPAPVSVAVLPTDTPIPAPTPTPNPAPALPPPPAESLLAASLEALAGVDSWHLDMEMNIAATLRGLTIEAPVTYTGDFQAPNRMEGTLSMRILGLTVGKDTVLIARTLDFTEPGTEEGTASSRPASMFSLLRFTGFEPADVKDLEFVGEETLDGTPVYHLKGHVSAQDMEVAPRGAQVALEGQVEFEAWIGVADSLPRQGAVAGTLAAVDGGQGSLRLTGSTTFSDFGAPASVQPPEHPTVAGGMPCSAADSSFVEYDDEVRAINFCYPSDWVVNDLVDGCGFFAVSPTGVTAGTPMPECVVLIYPHQTVARFGDSAAGAVEVLGQTSLCFFEWVRNALNREDGNTVLGLPVRAASLMTRGFLTNDPLVGMVTGIKYDDAKAVTIGCLTDEERYRSIVESITSLIVVGKPAER